jgi:hypothetical protein
MFQRLIDALNAVQPRVWGIAQFVLLLGVLCFGGWLVYKGHEAAGTALTSGSLALLKFEVSGKEQ